MVTHILALALLVSSSLSFAKTTQFTNELCAIEYADSYDKNFDEISATEIFEYKTITPELLKLINNHLIALDYTTKELSLEEIQHLFSQDGDYYYDGMTITYFQSNKSGQVYLQTMSWPGENPYSFNYNADTLELRAVGQDATITLVDKDQKQVCN